MLLYLSCYDVMVFLYVIAEKRLKRNYIMNGREREGEKSG